MEDAQVSEDTAQSNRMAEERTDWAEDRTLMANERTFAAWLRTGMASVAVGLGLHAVFWKAENVWLAKGGASIFILIGIAIFWLAQRQSGRVRARLKEHSAETIKGDPMRGIALALTAGAVAVLIILWRL